VPPTTSGPFIIQNSRVEIEFWFRLIVRFYTSATSGSKHHQTQKHGHLSGVPRSDDPNFIQVEIEWRVQGTKREPIGPDGSPDRPRWSPTFSQRGEKGTQRNNDNRRANNPPARKSHRKRQNPPERQKSFRSVPASAKTPLQRQKFEMSAKSNLI